MPFSLVTTANAFPIAASKLLAKSPVPKVAGCPFLGLLPTLQRGGLQAVAERLWHQAEEHGLAHSTLLTQPLVLVRDADLLRQVFFDQRDKISTAGPNGRGPFAGLKRMLGDSTFTKEGEAWHAGRHQALRHFAHAKSLARYFDSMHALTCTHLKSAAQQGTALPMNTFFLNFTMDVACQSALGMTNTTAIAPQLSEHLLAIINLSADFKHVLKHTLLAMARNQSTELADGTETRLRDTLRERMATLLLRPNAERIKTTTNLVRELWEQAGGQGESTLETEEVYASGTSILFASHETTSSTLLWTLYELAQHPEAVAAIREELTAVVGDAPLSHAHLRKLEYTERVIHEVLRLHPAAPMLARGVTEPLHLDTRLGSVVLPAGTQLLLSVFLNHRDPAVWGADAHQFVPDRFRDAKAERNLLSFGIGERRCAGLSFALQEIKIFLALALSRYDIEVHNAAQVQHTFEATLRSNVPLMATLHPRNR